MSKQITCALCGRPVDDADTVELPNGPVCLDPCYSWLERMMEDPAFIDDDEEIIVIYDPEEDDDDEESQDYRSL